LREKGKWKKEKRDEGREEMDKKERNKA